MIGRLALYRAATALAEPLAPSLLRARARRGKEDPARLGERLGHASVSRPAGRLAWLHGASVGESLSLLALVEALGARDPALNVLLTSGTVTAAELLARRLPGGALHQYGPVDAPGAARRFLDHWRPDLAVFAESELWPNLILAAKARGARLALVSARLSPASLRRWAGAAPDARALFGAFDLVLAQDDAMAAALAGLGARDDGRLNLKLAGAPLPVDEAALEAARIAAAGRPVLLAASTHPGEDEIILEAFGSLGDATDTALLVIVPRHPVRGARVAALAAGRGFSVGRSSAGDPFGAAPVYVADTLGELGLWYRLARAVFLGASLGSASGGHNPVEAVQLGVPVIVGPHVQGWAGVYDTLSSQGLTTTVRTAGDLARAFSRAGSEPETAADVAARARKLLVSQAHAVDAAAGRLLGLLT